MSETRQHAIKGNRMYWLDNLRTFMIFFVIVLHASVVYDKYAIGTGWWIVVDPSKSDVPGILNLIIDIFVMPTIFFIAGIVTPLSLKYKTRWAFLKSKFIHLIVPWLIAVLTLIPVYKMIFLYARHLPQEHWTTYFHWNTIWNQNWLWFLPVLFVFDILYMLFSKVNTASMTLKSAIWIVVLLSVAYSFCMDFFGFQGWTKTMLIDFQNERVAIYFLVFLLGAFCSTHNVFKSAGTSKKLNTLIHSTGWLPINLYLFLLIYSLAKPGDYLISEMIDTFLLRLNFVLSIAYTLYAMVTTFRTYLNTQGTLWNALNRNSYGVYIIHTVVMGGIAVTMLNTGIPSLIKYLFVIVSTFAVSNMIVYGYRKLMKPPCYAIWKRYTEPMTLTHTSSFENP